MSRPGPGNTWRWTKQFTLGDLMNGHVAPNLNGNSCAAEELIDRRPEAARKRLRECQDPVSAYEVIREIVSNLLGCEQMAVFQLDHDGRMSAMWSFGIEPQVLELSQIFKGSTLSSVMAGETQILGPGEKARAVVPIRFRGRTAGVLVLVSLLPQKTKLDELDRGLFDVLCVEAGRPLFDGEGKGSPALKGSDD